MFRSTISLFVIFFLFNGCSHNQKEFETRGVRLVPMLKGKKRSQYEDYSKDYMIATQGEHSTKAGSKMFKLGGNVVDAAAAISFAISVERPQSTGLGGGGFLLIHLKGMKKPIAFDFREKAPLNSHEKIFLDEEGNEIKGKSLNGIFAVGVPGLVAGIVEIHRRYGKLPLSTVVSPAIELAEKGFRVYPHLAKALKAKKNVLKKFPSTREIFFKGKRVLRSGELLRQPDLGHTLREIGQKGKQVFYRGWIAKNIVRTSKRYGGLLTLRDFKKYNLKERAPIEGSYKDLTVYSMPPPSSGGIHVIQILNILEKDNIGQYGAHAPESVHLTASAMQAAFADRAKYLGDSDFVTVPMEGLTSKKYARNLRSSIPNSSALRKKDRSHGNPFGYESSETTHFSIMDKAGNSISSTQTINGWFGSGLIAEGTGIMLNNEMDDFATKIGAKNLFGAIGGENNLVHPEKRPLSSMSPTIVFRGKRPVFSVGAPGGTRILTCVAQTLLNYFEHKLPLYQSVAAVRYHHQWFPDELKVDEFGLPDDTMRSLKGMGHNVIRKNVGCFIQAVAWEGEVLHGVSDPRGEGMSYGP